MTAVAVNPWEVHSELALVSTEVRSHALEQLAPRRPYAFLDFSPTTVTPGPPALAEPRLAHEVPVYVLRRVLQTAQTSLTLVGSLVAIALAAELFH
jgi:hypothetical protein